LGVRGEVCRACEQRVLVYGGGAWPVKVEDMRHLERMGRVVVGWMCGDSPKGRMSSGELYARLEVGAVSGVEGVVDWGGVDALGGEAEMVGCLLAGTVEWLAGVLGGVCEA